MRGSWVAGTAGMKTMAPLAFLAAGSILLGGCVSKNRYDQAVASTELTRAELELREGQLLERNNELQRRNYDLEQAKNESSARRAELTYLQQRLAQVEASERANAHRAATYKLVTEKLQKQIDAGDLSVITRDGRIILQLPNDVLFDSGKTEIRAVAKFTLIAVADTLKAMPGRQFQIAGHTDNVPIHTGRFPSNWELSSGRALAVVHFLLDEGVPEGVLSAAGYSDIDPVASNTTPEGRKANRRTEITLQPNIDELVKLPDAQP